MSENDASMKELALADLVSIAEQKRSLQAQIEAISAGEIEEEEMPKELILEIRAGAGGDEAALFAAELVEMYKGYAAERAGDANRDESKNDIGGYKEANSR